MLPQFTTMNVIDGQAGLMSNSSLIFYSLTIDNILNIIVLLILAAVSIATLTGENGILTRATDAKEQTEIADEKEAIQLAYAGAVAEKRGTEDVTATDLNNEFTINGRTDAYADGENPITVTFDSGRSYTVDSNGNISDPEEANIIATMKIEGTKVTTDPPMPNGNFEHVDGTIDTGYVIRDTTNGNEFVWVPVDQNQRIEINVISKEDITSITLTDPYGDEILKETNKGTSYSNPNVPPTINGPYVLKVSTVTDEKTVTLGVHTLYAIDTMMDWMVTEEYAESKGVTLEDLLQGQQPEEIYKMQGQELKTKYQEQDDEVGLNHRELVEKSGGFYIGRYEASYDDSVSGGRVASKESTSTRTSRSTPLANGMLWNYVSQTEALNKSKEMYTGISTLLTGAAWDRTLGWLEETGAVTSFEIVADSSTWGNYADDEFSNTTGLINTGEYGETEKNHIYDLAGNLYEWTTEADDTDFRVDRGRWLQHFRFSPSSLLSYLH